MPISTVVLRFDHTEYIHWRELWQQEESQLDPYSLTCLA